jgi:hypothetical protein
MKILDLENRWEEFNNIVSFENEGLKNHFHNWEKGTKVFKIIDWFNNSLPDVFLRIDSHYPFLNYCGKNLVTFQPIQMMKLKKISIVGKKKQIVLKFGIGLMKNCQMEWLWILKLNKNEKR